MQTISFNLVLIVIIAVLILKDQIVVGMVPVSAR